MAYIGNKWQLCPILSQMVEFRYIRIWKNDERNGDVLDDFDSEEGENSFTEAGNRSLVKEVVDRTCRNRLPPAFWRGCTLERGVHFNTRIQNAVRSDVAQEGWRRGTGSFHH